MNENLHTDGCLSKNEVKPPQFFTIKTMAKRSVVDLQLQAIPEHTTHVHINGIPFLFAIKEMIRRLPELQCIRVTPRNQRNLQASHRTFLKESRVTIVTGSDFTGSYWKREEVRDKGYKEKQKFFRDLTEAQQKCFKRLLEKEDRKALITSRYLCLEGEHYLPMNALCEDPPYSWSPKSVCTISSHVQAVIHYLDPTISVTKTAASMAKTMHRIEKAEHEQKRREEERDAHMRSLGITFVPKKLPDELLNRYATLRRLFVSKQLHNKLHSHNLRLRLLLIARYGLKKNTPYMSAQELAQCFERKVVTTSLVYQLEKRALTILGVTT